MDTPKRYHPLLVSLHWLVAILVTLDLFIGKFVFSQRDYPDLAIAMHMAAGLSVLALVIVRFIVRIRIKRPAEATSGSKILDILAKLVHYGLYVLLLSTTIIGASFARGSGRMQAIFFGAEPGLRIPQGSIDTLRMLHGLSATLLLLLIVVHILAAIYHQFILKDRLIARMWYGRR